MKDELCDVCRITYADTLEPSAKWVARHKRHREREARRNPGKTPALNCEWSREANRLYHADYEGRSRERKRAMPEKPGEYVSSDSICDVCGITADSVPSDKFRTRHTRAGDAPCEAAIESRRVEQQRPRQRARGAEAAERRAGLDSETDVPLNEDGLDEEEVELERRLAS